MSDLMRMAAELSADTPEHTYAFIREMQRLGMLGGSSGIQKFAIRRNDGMWYKHGIWDLSQPQFFPNPSLADARAGFLLKEQEIACKVVVFMLTPQMEWEPGNPPKEIPEGYPRVLSKDVTQVNKETAFGNYVAKVRSYELRTNIMKLVDWLGEAHVSRLLQIPPTPAETINPVEIDEFEEHMAMRVRYLKGLREVWDKSNVRSYGFMGRLGEFPINWTPLSPMAERLTEYLISREVLDE